MYSTAIWLSCGGERRGTPIPLPFFSQLVETCPSKRRLSPVLGGSGSIPLSVVTVSLCGLSPPYPFPTSHLQPPFSSDSFLSAYKTCSALSRSMRQPFAKPWGPSQCLLSPGVVTVSKLHWLCSHRIPTDFRLASCRFHRSRNQLLARSPSSRLQRALSPQSSPPFTSPQHWPP